MIKSSLDWPAIETDFLKKSAGLAHSRDIKKMIHNLQNSVSELSKAEVLARRGKPHLAEELLAKVNDDIKLLEEFILIAALLG